MAHFSVLVSYTRDKDKRRNRLCIRSSDTMSAREKAHDIVSNWDGVIAGSVKVEECVLDNG